MRVAGPLAHAVDLAAYRLAGGTSLAWAYGHRQSDDLDFFTRIPKHLDAAESARIIAALRRVDSDTRILTEVEATIHAVVRGCRVSFFGIGGRWLNDPVRVAEGLSLATIDEIAAMKMLSVAARSSKKDFFDIHELVSRGFDAGRLFGLWQQTNDPAMADVDAGRHIVWSLTYFEGADAEPDPISLNGTTWSAAKATARSLSESLEKHLRHLERHARRR